MTTDIWLPGFERIPNAKSMGGTYLDGVPWRFVGHTTEAVPTSVIGARSMAARHDNPPQLWVWWEKLWRAQTVPLNRSGFALLHPKGYIETNKMRAIQVEVIGRAILMEDMPLAFWKWLGTDVLRPILDAGIPINLDHVAPSAPPAQAAGHDGAVRMSDDEWRHFDGLCAHQNVPHNEHSDMGRSKLAIVATSARPASHTPPTPVSEEDIMAHWIKVGTDERAAFAMPDGEVIEKKDLTTEQQGSLTAVYVSKTALQRQVDVVQDLNRQSRERTAAAVAKAIEAG